MNTNDFDKRYEQIWAQYKMLDKQQSSPVEVDKEYKEV